MCSWNQGSVGFALSIEGVHLIQLSNIFLGSGILVKRNYIDLLSDLFEKILLQCRYAAKFSIKWNPKDMSG